MQSRSILSSSGPVCWTSSYISQSKFLRLDLYWSELEITSPQPPCALLFPTSLSIHNAWGATTLRNPSATSLGAAAEKCGSSRRQSRWHGDAWEWERWSCRHYLVLISEQPVSIIWCSSFVGLCVLRYVDSTAGWQPSEPGAEWGRWSWRIRPAWISGRLRNQHVRCRQHKACLSYHGNSALRLLEVCPNTHLLYGGATHLSSSPQYAHSSGEDCQPPI